jgi:lysophospholipase L1-like esterase
MSYEEDNSAWIYGTLLVIAGIGVVKALKNRCSPKVSAGSKVLLIGDSLAVGMDPYFRTMAREAGAEYQSMAVKSTTITAWTQNPALPHPWQPDLVLVSLGTNDAYGSRPLEFIGHDTLALLNKLGPNVVWILPPKLGKGNRGVSDVIRSTGVAVFESEALGDLHQADGVHPSGAGYAAWSGEVWRSLICGNV